MPTKPKAKEPWPPKPRPNHVPAWLARRMRRASKVKLCRYGDMALQEFAAACCGGYFSWMDHWGSFRCERRGVVFVSEPYRLHARDLQSLLTFCERLELKFFIDGCSYHNPNATLRIEIWEKPDEPVVP
jgi:hypothetical protein